MLFHNIPSHNKTLHCARLMQLVPGPLHQTGDHKQAQQQNSVDCIVSPVSASPTWKFKKNLSRWWQCHYCKSNTYVSLLLIANGTKITQDLSSNPPTIFNPNKGPCSRGAPVVRWCWVNFQSRGVLLIWIRVGQGPIALAVGVGRGLFERFLSPLSFLSSFSLSLGDGLIQTEILSQRAA